MTNQKSGPPDEIATLERFIVRARRVLAHSLCADWDKLSLVADQVTDFIPDGDGITISMRVMPNEEHLESLASRVRPLLLQQDGIHYSRVLKCLSNLSRQKDRQWDIEWCRETAKDWKSVDATEDTPTMYTMVGPLDGSSVSEYAKDSDLAHDWLYGDLVHAQAGVAEASSYFSIHHRYRAAAIRTAQYCILTKELLEFVWYMVEDGVIPIDREALEAIPVTARVNEPKRVALFRGGVESTLPTDLVDLSEEWSPVEVPEPKAVTIPWGCDHVREEIRTRFISRRYRGMPAPWKPFGLRMHGNCPQWVGAWLAAANSAVMPDERESTGQAPVLADG